MAQIYQNGIRNEPKATTHDAICTLNFHKNEMLCTFTGLGEGFKIFNPQTQANNKFSNCGESKMSIMSK